MDDRVVIGPLFTAGGFQSWFFICFEDVIVATPQGFWFSIASFMSGTGLGVHFGAVGGLIGALAQGSGKTQESKRITKLREDPKDALLSAKGNVVYRTAEIASLELKRVTIGSPELIVTTHAGKRKVYGVIAARAFDDVTQAIQAVYPKLFVAPPPKKK
jgi:hypothetical protein